MVTTKKTTAKKAAKPSLSQLQKKLNTDTRLRNEFLKDPGGVLRKQGLEIPAEKERALADFTKQVTGKQVSIDSIRTSGGTGAGARANVEVEVSVKVRF